MRRGWVKLIKIITLISFFIILGWMFYRELEPLDGFYEANDLKRKGDLAKIQGKLELYYLKLGTYPKSSKTEPLYRIIRPDGTVAQWGDTWIPFMDKLPKDPFFKTYVYYSSGDGQSYYIYASLDKGGNNPTRSTVSNGIPEDACKGICNYGVSSKNVKP